MPAFALYGLFLFWPMLDVGWLALQRWNGYGPRTFIGLANFGALLGDPLFRTSLEHSAVWEVSATVMPSVVALGLALLLSRGKRQSFFLAVFFFPALLPATVVAAIWVLVYSPISGLLNTLLRAGHLGTAEMDWLGDPHLALGALFVAWLWSSVGIGVLIFRAGLLAIGREYTELALVEGAGALWRFRNVTLPGLRRVGVIVLLINAALGAQVFDLVFVTKGGGPGYATMILPLEIYGRAFGGRTGQGAAAACLAIGLGLILVALAVLLLRDGGESLDSGDAQGAPMSAPVQEGAGMWRTRYAATAALTLALIAVVLPVAWLLIAALERGRSFDLGATGPGFDPRNWAWTNFATVWDTGMGSAMQTSLLIALVVVVASVSLALPAAFALAHLVRARLWKYGALALLLVGLLQPTPVLSIPLFSLLKDLGLLNTVWGILLPEVARTLPFAVLVLWGFLAQSPREIMDAAAVDGAQPFQQLVRIALPLVRPAIFAVGIWSFITSWNEYLLPTLVSQDGSLQTVPTLLASFVGSYDTQFGLLAAGSLMAIAPSLLIYLSLRRPAASGLARAERTLR
jgi:ABC-type sugar transport system permease subunit